MCMKGYESPNAEFVKFDNSRINTAGSKCNCYAEKWDFEEYDLDNPPVPGTGCKMETRDFYEIADAAVV